MQEEMEEKEEEEEEEETKAIEQSETNMKKRQQGVSKQTQLPNKTETKDDK